MNKKSAPKFPHTLNLRIDDDINTRIARLAGATEKDISFVARKALRRGLRRLEREYEQSLASNPTAA